MQEVIEKLSTLPALFASIPAISGRKARVNPRQGASLRRASQERGRRSQSKFLSSYVYYLRYFVISCLVFMWLIW